jgi:hypothetical protein
MNAYYIVPPIVMVIQKLQPPQIVPQVGHLLAREQESAQQFCGLYINLTKTNVETGMQLFKFWSGGLDTIWSE